MKFTFTVPVWGQPYLHVYLTHALHSHVAAGLRGDYIVHTDKPDLVIPSLELALRAGFECNIKVIPIEPEASYFQFSEYQKAVFDQSDACVFLSPDAVISRTTFTALQKAVAQGKKLIECPGINTVGGCPPLNAGMGAWCRDHLIPTLAGNVWGSDSPDMMCPLTMYFSDGPNYWTHAFYHHPLCAVNDGRWVNLIDTTTDWQLPQCYSPDETTVLSGLDALVAEISPPHKFDNHPRYRITNARDFAGAVRASRLPCHDNLFRYPVPIVGTPTGRYDKLIGEVLDELRD